MCREVVSKRVLPCAWYHKVVHLHIDRPLHYLIIEIGHSFKCKMSKQRIERKEYGSRA